MDYYEIAVVITLVPAAFAVRAAYKRFKLSRLLLWLLFLIIPLGIGGRTASYARLNEVPSPPALYLMQSGLDSNTATFFADLLYFPLFFTGVAAGFLLAAALLQLTSRLEAQQPPKNE